MATVLHRLERWADQAPDVAAQRYKKDGKWHAIRVEVRDGRYNVRARRGYVAS